MISIDMLIRMITISSFAILSIAISKDSYADYDCSDWINANGYCKAYVQSKINTRLPQGNAIDIPGNKEIRNVSAGDAAILRVGKYGHIVYVESVKDDGKLNISEMNYGRALTLQEFRSIWPNKKPAQNEWERAVSCGVTSQYGRVNHRSIPLSSVYRIWSPNPGGGNSNNKSYKIRITNIDDRGECEVNDHKVASVNYYGDTGWVDISNKLHGGVNEIEFKVKNEKEGFTYYFGFMEDGTVKWEKSCGKVGREGCDKKLSKGKALTQKIKVKL